MYDEIITLISQKKDTDEYGDQIETRIERQIYAKIKDIGQSEFYQAQAVGLKPELKFVIADYMDYNNEKKLIYKPFFGEPEEYSVIRTYRKGMELEIICKRGIE